MSKVRILFSIPTKHHVEIAVDEMEGLQELGYYCGQFTYAAKDGVESKTGRIWVIFQNAFNLIKTAYRFRPDIIYFNSRLEVLAGIRDFITIALFKILYPKKVLFFMKSHGSDLDVVKSKSFLIKNIVLPFLKKNISAWLFLSTEERDQIIQTGYFADESIFVTQNIVRTEQFKKDADFKNRLNIPHDHKILLFVGRIIKEKGIYQVIEAFNRIKDSYKATLIIVGDGSELGNIKQTVAAMRLTNQVILTGFIPEHAVISFYANSDILVFPTFFPEGFPMALFNSLAAGLAIVTTPIRAATDFLSEPENCLWVKSENSESVYVSLCKLFENETIIIKMKLNNTQKAKMFSKEKISVNMSKIIDSKTVLI